MDVVRCPQGRESFLPRGRSVRASFGEDTFVEQYENRAEGLGVENIVEGESSEITAVADEEWFVDKEGVLRWSTVLRRGGNGRGFKYTMRVKQRSQRQWHSPRTIVLCSMGFTYNELGRCECDNTKGACLTRTSLILVLFGLFGVPVDMRVGQDKPSIKCILTCILSHVSTPVMYSISGTRVFAFGSTTIPSMSKFASINCDTIGPELTPGQSVLNKSCIGSMLPSASLEMLSPLKASKP